MNAQPLPYTHLSLSRYAEVMGINPVHFAGAAGTNYWPAIGSCEQVWPRHVWQTTEDIVSHEEISNAIYQAEEELKSVLGFSLAPEWDIQLVRQYPQDSNPLASTGFVGLDIQGKNKALVLDKKRIISPGRKSTSLITSSAAITYSDPDGDGWNELATISVATTVTEKSELHVFFAGTEADPSWEIRPIKSITLSGGTATITFDSWDLIDPDKRGAYPIATGVLSALDVEDSASFVSTADVYRVYNDTTEASVEFLWENQRLYGMYNTSVCPNCGGSGCDKCALIQQSGCFSVRDANRGVITPFPATYNESTEMWNTTTWSQSRDPDQARIYMRSGVMSQDYLNGKTLDPLDREAARAIAWLATARLHRQPCSCANVDSLFKDLRVDLTSSSRNKFNVRFSTMDIFKSPFGFHEGEVRAWKYVNGLGRNIELSGALL